MYDQFLQYIRDEALFTRQHKLLLAVSGGIDSVVLTSLIDRLGNDYALAHCNFKLRGEDADTDEMFVQNLAEKLGVSCYRKSFQTNDYAREKGISMEMAARELRYTWFESVREEQAFDFIVVGHHFDDVMETFLLNLSRGTGIRGLTGIRPKNGLVVRPLLFATRNDIEAYASEHQLEYRHDGSNDDTSIRRNLVRHQLLPLFRQLNPAFTGKLEQSIRFLDETKQVYFQKIEEVRATIVRNEGPRWYIDIKALQELKPLSVYLYELLRPFHFNADVVELINRALNGTPGSMFFSPDYRLVIDREELIVTPLELQGAGLFYIEGSDQFVTEPLPLKLTSLPLESSFVIPKSPDIAVLDADTIQFPLIVRKWKQGEYFRPLGMKGFKKLSDFFIDEHYSIPDKEEAWILASGDQVVWIIGKRIDDRFKITPSTQKVLRIEWIKKD
ncbi:MAG: tRNA lysidine(34) synthetase TilS [Prolixibacteraceae bacterium]|nr:tRNA lysidine(34) synthetase TilS [Prolixibacteraceae bacterium]